MHESKFIHPKAIVEPGAKLDSRTRVWAFAHILFGATVGTDVNICDHGFIENDVVLGDRVTMIVPRRIGRGIEGNRLAVGETWQRLAFILPKT